MASSSVSTRSNSGKSAGASSERQPEAQVSVKDWIGVMSTLLGAFISEFAV